ncbi:MAG TPA: hypothetical protein VHS31_12360 [Tepidisphaeraceae bacterium]|nr:hypothetical protein [Tepidisphaeraceae bacterium]
MNIRQPLLRHCTIGCGLLILSLCILPDVSRAAIDPKIKSSSDAGTGPNLALIQAAVKGAVADLSGDDPVKRQAARDQLGREVNAVGSVVYTSQFYETYSKELNTQLAPLLANPDAKVRLNVAIVVAQVAARVNNTYMLDLTEKLLADKSPAVAMWGLMAAQNILPSLLQAGLPAQQQKLIADIKAHAKDSELLAGVYDALSLNYPSVKMTNLPPNWNKAVAGVVPEILSLLSARRDLYRTQVVKEPSADVDGMNCLVNAVIWDQMNPTQQFQTIQVLSDIAGLAGQHADGSGGEEREQLVYVMNKAVSAIVAAAIHLNYPTFRASVQPILNVQPSGQNIAATVGTLPAAIKQIPAWAKVTDAPSISAGATTNPSTATAK